MFTGIVTDIGKIGQLRAVAAAVSPHGCHRNVGIAAHRHVIAQ